jgi:hypothetical protein
MQSRGRTQRADIDGAWYMRGGADACASSLPAHEPKRRGFLHPFPENREVVGHPASRFN